MQYNATFGFSETGPGKNRKAQIDDGGIQNINCFLKLKDKIIVQGKLPCMMDENLRKVTICPPVSIFSGINNCTAGYFAPDSYVVKLLFHGAEATFNITEALAIG